MGSLYLWGRSIQEIGSDVVIGRFIYYGVVVIDGSLYSRFYGITAGPLKSSSYAPAASVSLNDDSYERQPGRQLECVHLCTKV